MPDRLLNHLVSCISEINEEISQDNANLGRGFEIGHSFFTPIENVSGWAGEWYKTVVKYEVEPLLREYWFEDPTRATDAIARLLNVDSDS